VIIPVALLGNLTQYKSVLRALGSSSLKSKRVRDCLLAITSLVYALVSDSASYHRVSRRYSVIAAGRIENDVAR
jgi:hypothetical protein